MTVQNIKKKNKKKYSRPLIICFNWNRGCGGFGESRCFFMVNEFECTSSNNNGLLVFIQTGIVHYDEFTNNYCTSSLPTIIKIKFYL